MTTSLEARTDAAIPHPSVAALRALGFADPVGAPRDLSRAHGVWAAEVPGIGRVVVKTGAMSTDAAPSLGAELFVQRMAVWCDALRVAMPPVVALDEAQAILIATDAGAGRAASLALVADGLTDAVFHDLGARLGAVHRETARMPLPRAAAPLVLAVLPRAGATGLSPAGDAVVARLRAERGLVADAARLRAAAAVSLVHHDLKWDNVVVTPEGEPLVIDWELAGAGDPAWDVGCLVAEHLLRGDAADAVLRGYATGARLAPGAVAVFAGRVAAAATLRVAQFAIEVAERDAGGDLGPAHDVAARAIALHRGIPRLTEEVRSCLTR